MSADKNKTTYTAAEMAEMQTAVKTLQAENAELKRQLDHMTQIFLNAQRARFGRSSEKEKYVLGNDQISIFNEAEVEQNPKAPEPDENTLTVKEHQRKKKRTFDEIVEGLPVRKVLLELENKECVCDLCDGKMRKIGEKFVRRELKIIPKQVEVVEYYSTSYACDRCEKQTGYANIVSTVAPPALMKHSLASPSSVAEVMTRKYVDALPLARQEKIWKREGIELSRTTMANWVIYCAQSYLKHLLRHMKQRLMEENVIHADETVVQVLKEDGKTPESTSRMWLYASGERSSTPIRIFEYQPDRSGKRAETFLKNFSGFLVTDGYSGYNGVSNVIRFGCWAHMKRKWRDAMPEGATVQNSKSAVGYQFCNKIFAKERNCKEMNNKTRTEYRQNFIRPILEEYYCWLNTVNPEKGSKLAEAVTYARNQKAALCAFIDHGEVPISNNLAENAIRPFVQGRKNWMFSDSVKGADSSAVVYSIVETAKANDIEPSRYLEFVLDTMRWLGKTPSHDDLELLMPWRKAVKLKCSSETESK